MPAALCWWLIVASLLIAPSGRSRRERQPRR